VNDRDQTTAFADEIDKLVERFRDEFDITYAAVVGVLTMKAHIICQEAAEQGEE
jgi:ribosomal protein L7/L12